MKKITNEEKVKIYKTRKVLRIGTMIFSVLTIVFAVLTLVIKINPIFSVICLVIEVGLTKYRDKIDYKK